MPTKQTEPITTAIASTPQQPLTARTRQERRRVTGRLKLALDAMVYEGLRFDQAAVKHGLTVRTMRYAIERPHVIAYLKQQKQVFRASISAQNIHRLAELRDTSENGMVRLGAVKILEQVDDERERAAAARTPGVVIQIIGQQNEPKPAKMIDVTPAQIE